MIADFYCSYNIYWLVSRMLCCGKQEVIKKKSTAPVFEKTSIIPKSQSSQLYPKNIQELRSAPKMSSEEVLLKKSNLKKVRTEQLVDIDEFRSIPEGKKQDKKVKLKKLEKCGYNLQEMNAKFKGKKEKWTDPDFNYEDINYHGKNALWKRPEEFIDSPDLFPPEISPNDIIQGYLNDCYFLSAVSALAQRPHRILELFQTKQYNSNGYYICKLNFNGIYQEVIVDDLFPVRPDNNQALYGQPAQKKYIWVLILEKCWAKFLKGYSNCNYGYTNEAFQALTGAPTKAYLLGQYKQVDPGFENIFQLLKESDEKDYVMQISRNRASNQQQERKSVLQEGLPMGHAYSLLGVYQTTLKNGHSVKLLQVRNPWGTQESQITWNDNDPKWDLVLPAQKQRMQYRYNKRDNDGVFYMQWSDFTKKFDHLFSICQINDEANYAYLRLTAQDRVPIYFQVETNGDPDYMGIYFVQEMQEHFKESYRYCGVSVVISKIQQNSQGETEYHMIGTYNYYNSALDNYFTLPIRKAPKGRYMIRLYVWWPQMNTKQAPIVAGIYSAATIGIKKVTTQINDEQFIEKNCLSDAKQNKHKQQVANDPHSWVAKAIIKDTNIGYVLFHYGANSQVKDYRLKFDQRHNKPLYFLLDYRGENVFEVDCQKGYEYVIVYAYKPEHEAAMDKHLYPTYDPNFKLPTIEIVPL